MELPALEKQGLRDCQTSAIENLDKSFKDVEAVEQLLDLPVLAAIPKIEKLPRTR